MSDCIVIHDTQKVKADEVIRAFDTASLVTFIAPPQWGKTGVAIQVILLKNPSSLFVITGMSDTDWVKQTKDRLPENLRDRVYHRNRLGKMIETLSTARDALVVIDECHYGSRAEQTMNRCFKRAGIWDIAFLIERNIKILCISATPVNVLMDGLAWGERHAIVIGHVTEAYTGFHTLLAENRIRPIDIAEDFFDTMIDGIDIRWKTPRWHIIRASKKVRPHLEKRGMFILHHTSASRIGNIDDLLSAAPPVHTFILIKQFWRAAKTLNDKYIGICFDMSRDCTNTAQGLGGRLLGFGKQRGIEAPLLYCNMTVLSQYVDWLRSDCDYLQCKRYYSSNLKIKDGAIQCQKRSTVHHEEVHIEPVPLVRRPVPDNTQKTSLRPVKIRIINQVPEGAGLFTTIDILDTNAFCIRFGIREIPEEAKNLSKNLKRNGVCANVSYSRNAAASRSNLINYFTHRHWAEDEYHISCLDGKTFVVIRRDKEALEKTEKGDMVVAHNHMNEMVLYRMG